jgi:hypothetical protein
MHFHLGGEEHLMEMNLCFPVFAAEPLKSITLFFIMGVVQAILKGHPRTFRWLLRMMQNTRPSLEKKL